jgi:hypothetical protein
MVEDAVVLKNQEYWEVQNLEITNKGDSAATRRGVHVVADNYGEMHHIYLRSLTIHDVNGADSDKVMVVSITVRSAITNRAGLLTCASRTTIFLMWTAAAFLAGPLIG